MYFSKAFLPLALMSVPIFAAPTPAEGVEENSSVDAVKRSSPLEARVPEWVTCRPCENESGTRSFRVNTANASKQASEVGLARGKSGDPHRYFNGAKKGSPNNGDALHFGVPDCDSKDADLYEYPVYWQGAKAKEWKKDTRTDKQENTPIRVVYVNKNGGSKYCGIMIHKKVTKDFKGQEDFELCE